MNSIEVLSDIALKAIGNDDFDNQMNSILKKIGESIQVSRVYIFKDSEDGEYCSNEYEWCNQGIEPQIEILQNFPYVTIPSWKCLIQENGSIFSDNINELPSDIQAILAPQNILSIIVYPLFINQKISGFIGFDECQKIREWGDFEKNLLKTICGIISNSYERNVNQNMLKKFHENFYNFFNSIEDLVVIADLDSKIIYANTSIILKLRYSLEELRTMKMIDLYPQDQHEEVIRLMNQKFHCNREYCPTEMEGKDQRRISVETRMWYGDWDGKKSMFALSKDVSLEYEALQKFTKLFENNPAIMGISSLPDRKLVDVNDAFVQKIGYLKEEVIGKTSAELGLFSVREEQEQLATLLQNNGKIKDMEIHIKGKDGRELIGLLSGEVINTQGHHYFMTVMVDVTMQKQLQKRLEIKRERLSNIINGTHLGTWEWNVQTGDTIFNERWAEIIGYKLEELKPVNIQTWMKFAHPEDLAKSEELLNKHFNKETEYYVCESRMKHKNGEWVWVLDRGKVFQWDENGKPLLMFGTHMDITEMKNMEEKIIEVSIRDPLTNVYNRRYIYERLENYISEFRREKRCFSVTIIDIDHFKKLNDRYGHLAGDFILKDLTQLMTKNIRPYDLLGRFGGEEFIIINLNIQKENAFRILDRILDIVRNTEFLYDNEVIRLTFSGGITDCSEFDSDQDSIESIIKRADDRLYQAKKDGRNRIICR